MSSLFSARAQMAMSLAFHIIFAALGVGLPLLLSIAEGIGLWKKDRVWYQLARRWERPFAILYAVGAVSGTILSFELGLLWPAFMSFSGGIIGLAFTLEAFAFFTEGIFLGLYLFGWERLSPRAHWLCSIPLWVGGLLSSLFITSANAWMNTPAGFQIVNGHVTHVNPIQAIFNPSMPSEITHMTIAAYEMTGFFVATIYAVALLRGHNTRYNRLGLQLSLAIGVITAPLQIITGDWSAKVVATYQPEKLAAMEGLFQTTKGAPETILGWPDMTTGHTYYGIQIPHLLSLLAFDNPNATVRGLYAFPRAQWPNAPSVHLAFDSMVVIGTLVLLIALWFWFQYFRHHRQVPNGTLTLAGIAAAGPLTVLALELGWMVTEEGRQPWVVYNILTTSQTVTPATWVSLSFVLFTLVYIILAITTVRLCLRVRAPQEQQDDAHQQTDQPPAPNTTAALERAS